MNARASSRFRILRGNGRTIRYATQQSRNLATRKWADLDGTSVLLELWSPEHPQDELNRGWACEGEVHPSPPPESKTAAP
ncbi:hypothetical protein LZ318_30860 [Saccharopolyspora indica]|uniref:hypothetical protein n=1 Tax=Saccharopolyspora indica TaxID=1229659 RepID=UPI0022EB90F0|nr:hypothetical protein [Saccharopolyspora indica]MDA3644366.1 hypothetical protein [Saccharopolyspora indica]